MNRKIIDRKKVVPLLLITCVLAFTWVSVFLRSETREPISDDLLYAFVLDENTLGLNDYSRRVESFSDAVESQGTQYFHSNGRTIVHVLVQMFAGPWGHTAWSIFLASMIVLAMFLFMKIVMPRYMHSPLIWMLTAVSFLYLYQYDGRIWYAIAGGMNYLWPIVMVLLWVWLAYIAGQEKAWYVWLVGIIVSVITGWGMECYSLPLCAAVLVQLIIDRKKQRTPLQYLMIALLWIGAAILTFAPGNFCRVKDSSIIERFKMGVQYLIGTYPFWLLVAEMFMMRIRNKELIRTFVRQNSFWWLCFGWSVALGLVANTLAQSFNGISFFSMILVFRGIPVIVHEKMSARMSYSVCTFLLVLFAVHQASIVACMRDVENEHRKFLQAYFNSSDGVMAPPEITIPSIHSRYVKSWFQSSVPGWTMLTISKAYTNGRKPITLLDSLDYIAVNDPDRFFIAANKVPGNSNLYYGKSYLWSRERMDPTDSLVFTYYPLTREDAGNGLRDIIWYYFKGDNMPLEQTVAIPDTNCVKVPGVAFVMKKPFKRRVKSIYLKSHAR